MCLEKGLSGLGWLVKFPSSSLGGCRMCAGVLPVSAALSQISANLNLTQILQLI